MVNFVDFPDGGTPADGDYFVGYAAGGGVGSDRRWLRRSFGNSAMRLLADVPGRTISDATFIVSGYVTVGDGGAGAIYSSVGATALGLMAVQDAVGTWFNLVPIDAVVPLGHFGAQGGFNDDTAAFDAAFSWLNDTSGPKGKTLSIPPGDYVKTGTHTVTRPFRTITGANQDAGIIYQSDDLDGIVFQSANPAADFMGGCMVENIAIRRTFGTAASAGVDLKFVMQFGTTIRNVHIFNAVNGLVIEGGYGYEISDINIGGSGDIVANVAGSALLKIKAYDNAGSPSQTNVVNITNFDISSPPYNANIDYAILITACDSAYISNGHCGQTKIACAALQCSALALDFIASVTFNNVFFDGGSSQYGVLVASPNAGQTIIMTKVVNSTISGNTVDGIKMLYPSYDTIVSNNFFIANTTGYGINCSGGATTIGFTATGNRFSDFNSHGVNIGGDAVANVSTLIANNNGADIAVATAAHFADKTHAINVYAKFAGKQAWSSDAARVVFAAGATDVSVWKDGVNTTVYTPV